MFKLIFAICVLLAISKSARITKVPSGYVLEKDGYVMSHLLSKPLVIEIKLPFLDASHVPGIGKSPEWMRTEIMKYDDHLKAEMSTWSQIYNQDVVDPNELMFMNNAKGVVRTKRFVGLAIVVVFAIAVPLVSATALVMSSINTNRVIAIRSKMDELSDNMDESSRIMEILRQEASDSLSLLNATIVRQDAFEKLTNDRFEEHEEAVKTLGRIVMEVSTIESELEHVREGRLPLKLIPKDLLSTIQGFLHSKEVTFPLRLVETKVIRVDKKSRTLMLMATLPVMQSAKVEPKLKVHNFGINKHGKNFRFNLPEWVKSHGSSLESIPSRCHGTSMVKVCNGESFDKICDNENCGTMESHKKEPLKIRFIDDYWLVLSDKPIRVIGPLGSFTYNASVPMKIVLSMSEKIEVQGRVFEQPKKYHSTASLEIEDLNRKLSEVEVDARINEVVLLKKHLDDARRGEVHHSVSSYDHFLLYFLMIVLFLVITTAVFISIRTKFAHSRSLNDIQSLRMTYKKLLEKVEN